MRSVISSLRVEKNLQSIVNNELMEALYPMFSSYLKEVKVVEKITMLLALFTNYRREFVDPINRWI